MAECLALLGAAAAAAQFAEVGFRIICRGSALIKKFRDRPKCLERALSQVQHLLFLAELTTENGRRIPTAETLLTHQIATNNLSTTAATSTLPGLESIWKDCAVQARILDEILQSTLKAIEERAFLRSWKNLGKLGRLDEIDRALDDLERHKTLLNLWLGQESLQQIHHLLYGVSYMHGDIIKLGKTVTQRYRESCMANH